MVGEVQNEGVISRVGSKWWGGLDVRYMVERFINGVAYVVWRP